MTLPTSRFLEMTLNRLRMGKNLLNKSRKFVVKDSDDLCSTCGVREDENHFLCECSRFTAQRQPIVNFLGRVGIELNMETLLGESDYLDTRLVRKINRLTWGLNPDITSKRSDFVDTRRECWYYSNSGVLTNYALRVSDVLWNPTFLCHRDPQQYMPSKCYKRGDQTTPYPQGRMTSIET